MKDRVRIRPIWCNTGAPITIDCGAVLWHWDAMIAPEKPVYLRLRDVIANAILDGKYGDGDMLPSVRALAAEEGANPLTVAKAYQSFQDDGLVVVKRGVGMFVADGASKRLRTILREDFLANVWPPVAAQIRRIGLDAAELVDRAEA